MPSIKNVGEIAGKWARVTPGRSGDYTRGIQNPKVDWMKATKDSEESYKRGVIEAANAGRFGKGVEDAGTKKWQENALKKGPTRFAAGVALGKDAYLKGFAPYADVIEKTDLPPRGPKGDPANIERVRTMAAALHERKMA